MIKQASPTLWHVDSICAARERIQGWRNRKRLGKIGIWLSGGGLTGVMHVHYLGRLFDLLRPLFPDRFPIEFVGGTSAGALTASTIAASETWDDAYRGLEYAREKWNWIEQKGPEVIFNTSPLKLIFSKHLWRGGHISPTGNNVIYRDLLGNFFDFKKVVEWRHPLVVGVYNHSRGRYEVLSSHDDLFNPNKGGNPELLRDAIVASASLAPYFPPIKIGEHWYSDGDYPRIVPALKAGCDTVIVLHSYPKKEVIGFREYGEYEETASDSFIFLERFFPPWGKALLDKYNKLRHRGREELERARNWILLNQGPWQRVRGLVREMARLSPKVPKRPRVVQVFPDNVPEQFSSDSFAPGDYAMVRKEAERKMQEAWMELLSQ